MYDDHDSDAQRNNLKTFKHYEEHEDHDVEDYNIDWDLNIKVDEEVMDQNTKDSLRDRLEFVEGDRSKYEGFIEV